MIVLTKTSDGTLIHDGELEAVLKDIAGSELPPETEKLEKALDDVEKLIKERSEATPIEGTVEQRAAVVLIDHFNNVLFPIIAETHTYNKVGNNRIDKLYIDYSFPGDDDRITLSFNIIQKEETKRIRILKCNVNEVGDLIYKEIASWIRLGLNTYIKNAVPIDDLAFI